MCVSLERRELEGIGNWVYKCLSSFQFWYPEPRCARFHGQKWLWLHLSTSQDAFGCPRWWAKLDDRVLPICVLTSLCLVLNHKHLGQGKGGSRSMSLLVLELFDCNFWAKQAQMSWPWPVQTSCRPRLRRPSFSPLYLLVKKNMYLIHLCCWS